MWRREGRHQPLATLVVVLAMPNKPNQLVLLLNFVALKYLSLSKRLFYEHTGGGLRCCTFQEQLSPTGELKKIIKKK